MSFLTGSRTGCLAGAAVAAAIAVTVGVFTSQGRLPGALGWPVEVLAAAATGLLVLLAFRSPRRPPEAAATPRTVPGLRFDELDPIRLGVRPAWLQPGGAAMPPYVPRTADAELDRALVAGGLVLVQGDAAAGKTRTAYEALLRNASRLGWQSVVIPRDDAALHELAHQPPPNTVVWLDDLERYLTTDALDDYLLKVLSHHLPPDSVVVATLRTGARAALAIDADGTSGQGRRVLTRISPIVLERKLDRTETTAAHRYRNDPRIAGAIVENAGLGERAAAGPEALQRWLSRENEAGAALVSAAVDLRRAGYLDPVPLDWLVSLHLGYLSGDGRGTIGDTDLAAALDWATQPVRGASPCLVAAGSNRYLAFGYLVDSASGEVPEAVWQGLLSTNLLTPAQRFRLARAAARFGRLADATALWTPLARGGDAFALYNLGWAAQLGGDENGAGQWFLRAAEAGQSWAMSSLGTMAEQHGDMAAAQSWYQRAADAGDTVGMTNLGGLYAQTGRIDLARKAYQRAAAAGDPNGPRKEAVLELLHGDRKRGADLLRRVALSGDPAAVRLLGLLSQPGEPQAHRPDVDALRQLAAEMGDGDTALDLARNLWNQGDLDAAETWFRRAATGENGKVAEFGLAVLLEQRGRFPDAEEWYLRAALHGLPEAMLNLGAALQERGEYDEAEGWYHRALQIGHLPAEVNLGALHWRRGNLEEGRVWYERAADRGDELAKQALESLEFNG